MGALKTNTYSKKIAGVKLSVTEVQSSQSITPTVHNKKGILKRLAKNSKF